MFPCKHKRICNKRAEIARCSDRTIFIHAVSIQFCFSHSSIDMKIFIFVYEISLQSAELSSEIAAEVSF